MFYMCRFQVTPIPDYAITNLGVIEFASQSVINPVLGPA